MHKEINGIDTVVFDLGGVLVDWNPRYLFRKLFVNDEAAMETFLADVCNSAWNERQDRGRTWAEAIEVAIAEHPGHAPHIRAYRERWVEMLGGAMDDTVQVLDELHGAGVRLIALTNWSAETFPYARERFEFLKRFEGVLVSGEENLMKPEPEIFQLLFSRYGLTPARTLFIDDVQKNVDAAIGEGMQAVRFSDAVQLRRALVRHGLPVDGPVG
ncbi:HAD family hydrolase [Pseudomonas sp. NPDC089401]|uniref:HAD family hydrolase n=1 Tax=Pseudomonas sp. NPDC089401 TaxID=3364462 RepID=UPI003803AB5D